MRTKITLEQWQALVTIIDAGGYAQAANALFKSQSAISYAVQKIEQQLQVRVLKIAGRKAVLTEVGEMLYRRGKQLLDEAHTLEVAARRLSAGWEAEISLAVEILFPPEKLMLALKEFANISPDTRVEVIESVLSGTSEAITSHQVQLAITPAVPAGFLGERLLTQQLIAVAHPEHPLNQLKRKIHAQDLRQYRHILVRDSGIMRDQHSSSLDVSQRWIFSHMQSSITAVLSGAGFAWLPHSHIHQVLASGELKALNLSQGQIRNLDLFLVLPESPNCGPGVSRLAELLTAVSKS